MNVTHIYNFNIKLYLINKYDKYYHKKYYKFESVKYNNILIVQTKRTTYLRF